MIYRDSMLYTMLESLVDTIQHDSLVELAKY